MRLVMSLLALSVLLPAVPAIAQTALPMGAPASGTAASEKPATYTVRAATAGVLSVAVSGTGDLTLALADADGQTVPNGTADRDLNGSTGTEILTVTITAPGDYRVIVTVFGDDSSTFTIAGSFLSFPAFEKPADPDGKPSQAVVVKVGEAHEDSLNSDNGDEWDWFVFTPSEDATLAVATRAADGVDIDLALAVFMNGNFSEPVDTSDRDLQDNGANEAVTVTVKAGQPVHVRVSSPFGSANGAYRISSSLIR
jgi:hypothetical protein